MDSKRLVIETLKHLWVTAQGAAAAAAFDYLETLRVDGGIYTLDWTRLRDRVVFAVMVALLNLYIPKPRLKDHTRAGDDGQQQPPTKVEVTVKPEMPPTAPPVPQDDSKVAGGGGG